MHPAKTAAERSDSTTTAAERSDSTTTAAERSDSTTTAAERSDSTTTAAERSDSTTTAADSSRSIGTTYPIGYSLFRLFGVYSDPNTGPTGGERRQGLGWGRPCHLNMSAVTDHQRNQFHT